jgi:PhzF family phenazine biosynthesis protein
MAPPRPGPLEVPLFVVDAFTSAPFRGNPAAVCLLDAEVPEAVMRAVAAEMRHSETAFVRPLGGDAARARSLGLRWFTPEVEVPLCGHATLASAAVLFREIGSAAESLVFETRSGPLAARREGERIALDFPREELRPAPAPPAVLAALGLARVEASGYARLDRNLLLHLPDEGAVRALAPDVATLRAAKGDAPFLGVIATARGSGDFDFVSRYFAPWVGVDEDPVTGSAHCALAPYWGGLLRKGRMRAHQASPRGGELEVRLRGDRVDLVGDAVVVATGRLRLGPPPASYGGSAGAR